MKTLIIGADGIAGSALMRAIPDAIGTTHHEASKNDRVLTKIDVTKVEDIRRALEWAKPRALVNCAGIVKSECPSNTPVHVGAVNGEAPHVIALTAAPFGCRVIHLSTDCVFDGSRGNRIEEDRTNATDLYGQTKASGELIHDAHCVTLRTSFIGHDHARKRGLLEWLLTQRRETLGFTRAMWSGLSVPELARVIRIVLNDENLSGLYHVAGPVISKADLLEILVEAFGLDCLVKRVDELYLDRTLYGSKFKKATGYTPPTWEFMAEELAENA